jgi:predicted DNA-binding transcriptional regulator AlpA
MNSEEQLISTAELCEWLKIVKSTVNRWRGEGLPHIGKERTYRYKKSEVLKWLEEQKNRSKRK